MQKMLRIIEIENIPKEEINLVIFMIKGVLENNKEWVNK